MWVSWCVPFSRAYKILNGFSSLQRMHTLSIEVYTYDVQPTCIVSSSSSPFAHIVLWVFLWSLFCSASLPLSISISLCILMAFHFHWFALFSPTLVFWHIHSKTDDYMQPKNGAGGLNGDIFLKFAQNKHFMVIFIGILTLDSPFAYTHNTHTYSVLICSCSFQQISNVWAVRSL